MLCCGCDSDNAVSMVKRNTGYSVIDARGKRIDFASKPKRIVSCYVYGDEILLDLVEHKRIAGLSRWVHDEDLSMASKQAEDVTVIAENNPEAILALNPDLVLLPSNSKPEAIANLEDIKLKVYVYQAPSRLDNIHLAIKGMGDAVGEPEAADKLIATMNNRLSKIAKKVAEAKNDNKTALLVLRFGAIGGSGCIYNDILTAAGITDGYNLARPVGCEKVGHSRVLSKEEIVKVNPDYLIMADWNQGGAYQSTSEHLQEIYDDPALATVKAVVNKQAIVVPQGYVNCLSHHAAESVELLFNAVNN